jgi:hypothetical protein
MTNFAYNNGVPAANNNPSIDQPQMLINTISIQDILDVDHVTLGDDNGGTHKQVAFSSNNTPSLPTVFPTLFTNLVGPMGNQLSQLLFYSGTAAQSSSQYVANPTAGSTFTLGGIIIKWGVVTINLGVSSANFSYAGSFINACFGVQITPATSLSPPKNAYISDISNLSQFTLNATPNANPGTYYYIAIGY